MPIQKPNTKPGGVFRSLAGTVLLALLWTACPARAEVWPMAGHDSGYSYATSDFLPLPLVLRQSIELPDGAQGLGMALAENTLAVVGKVTPLDGSGERAALYAYDAVTGVLQWSQSLGNGAAAPPAMDDLHAYVAFVDANAQGFLSAYSLKDGGVLWTTSADLGGVVAAPILYNSSIWLPGAKGRVLRWNAETGALETPVDTQLVAPAGLPQTLSAVSLTSDGLFATAWGGSIYAAPTETPEWRRDLVGRYPLPLTVAGPHLFLPVQADSATGSGVTVLGVAAGHSDGAIQGHVAALASNGDRLWMAESNGTFSVFDAFTGFLLGNPWPGTSRPSGLILGQNTAIFGDATGTLHALGNGTTDETWRFPTLSPQAATDFRFFNLLATPTAEGNAGIPRLYSLRDDGLMLVFGYGRYGDLNGDGDVTIGDVTLALRASVGLVSLAPDVAAEADVAPAPGPGRRPVGDESVDLKDVVSLLRRAVGTASPNWPLSSE